MASIDQTIVATALPAIETRTARHHQLERLDDLDLRARPGHRHADGREDQRHVRPQEGLHDLRGHLHPRPRCAAASRRNMAFLLLRAVHPGARRRRVHAVGDRHRVRSFRRGAGPRGRACSPPSSRSAASIGPVVGGLFVSYWSWRGIFLVNVPIGIVLIALTAKFIPASATRPASRIDIHGILLLAVLDRDRHVRHHLPGQRAGAAVQPGLPRLRGGRGRDPVPVRQALAARLRRRSCPTGCCAGAASAS